GACPLVFRLPFCIRPLPEAIALAHAGTTAKPLGRSCPHSLFVSVGIAAPRFRSAMPTSSWACPQVPGTEEHAHEDVGMPPTGQPPRQRSKNYQTRTLILGRWAGRSYPRATQ